MESIALLATCNTILNLVKHCVAVVKLLNHAIRRTFNCASVKVKLVESPPCHGLPWDIPTLITTTTIIVIIGLVQHFKVIIRISNLPKSKQDHSTLSKGMLKWLCPEWILAFICQLVAVHFAICCSNLNSGPLDHWSPSGSPALLDRDRIIWRSGNDDHSTADQITSWMCGYAIEILPLVLSAAFVVDSIEKLLGNYCTQSCGFYWEIIKKLGCGRIATGG